MLAGWVTRLEKAVEELLDEECGERQYYTVQKEVQFRSTYCMHEHYQLQHFRDDYRIKCF